MPITIYGIPNCDTMKKARTWLEAHGVDYAFHDYRASGLEPARLDAEVSIRFRPKAFRALVPPEELGA